MSKLVDVNGEPLAKTVKRSRRSSQMKKNTPKGDVLFKLIVDIPDGLGEDDFNRIMVEYFGIGKECFERKSR